MASLCSCTPTCACAIHARTTENGGSGLVTITGNGDTAQGGWEVDVSETVWAGANDDGTLAITPGGSYGHDPHINMRLLDSPTVGLVATANGLQAHVLDAPAGVGGVPTGTVLPYMGDVAPSGFLMCTGPYYSGYVSQADYGGLFSIVEHKGSGGVDPGNGTFAVPYLGDRFLAGQGSWGGIGTPGGLAAVTLGVGEMPHHGHGVSDPTHGHPGTSSSTSIGNDGVHFHEAGTDRLSHFVTVEEPVVGADYHAVETGGGGNVISFPTHLSPDPGVTWAQGDRAATSNDGLHAHSASTSTSVAAAATGVSILGEGGGGAHENRPPFMVVNYIIKT